jgi:hypothetical protein
MPSMIVLVNIKESVSLEAYERWVLESYAPAVRELPSVEDWRAYRATDLLGSGAAPPYRYVVTLEIEVLDRLGCDMASEDYSRQVRLSS